LSRRGAVTQPAPKHTSVSGREQVRKATMIASVSAMRMLVLVAALLVACGSGESSPAGPVGSTYDVRSDLKPEVATRAPSDDKAMKHEHVVDVQGVKAKIVWRHRGPHRSNSMARQQHVRHQVWRALVQDRWRGSWFLMAFRR